MSRELDPGDAGLLARRLDRERRARAESERIAETITRELYARERQLEVMHRVAAMSNESHSAEAAIEAALALVHEHTGWRGGRAFVRDPASQALEATADGADAGERCLAETCIEQGAPGWALDSAGGPGGVLAFPILVGDRAEAVMTFRSTVARPPDAALLELMQTVGAQLGRVVERERAQRSSREVLRQTEKLAGMGSMLAGMAHELNNPLSVVMGEAALLRAHVGVGEGRDRLGRIIAATERAARIVHNFLSIARHRPRDFEPTRLEDVVRAALEVFGHQMRVDGVELRLDLAPGLPPLVADAHQLQQVVINLLSNAQHALRQSSGRRVLAVSARLDAPGECVVLEIRDTGPGIPPEVLGRIFDPFFTTKAASGGTGLGLSLCRTIVEEHRGTIHAESVPGEGSSFLLRFPVTAAAGPGPDGAPRPAAEPAPGPRAILVVEDEADVAGVLRDLLALDGHRVDLAPDGQAALERIGRQDYDVIFCDLRMPRLDGPGLFRELQRTRPELCSRVVFVSGDALSLDVRAFLQETASPALGKPLLLDELRHAIREVETLGA